MKYLEESDLKLDPNIDDQTDDRLGLTLLIRPNNIVNEQIQQFLECLKQIAPNQYYYPSSDVHVTVMSIIPSYSGFTTKNIDLPAYTTLVRKSIADIPKFTVHFKGITLSPSAVMIQGFLEDNCLNQLRDNLRTNFKQSGLEQGIDKRYKIKTAHCTVIKSAIEFVAHYMCFYCRCVY
jgi:2'-5' RNA ligase